MIVQFVAAPVATHRTTPGKPIGGTVKHASQSRERDGAHFHQVTAAARRAERRRR